MSVRVRFAPSPTGSLHLGNALSATANRAYADTNAGILVLRIDDTDPERNVPGGEEAIVADLDWLGIEWDDPVLIQSERGDAYEDALEDLKARGLAFACFCTRADIAQSLTAPHGDAATSYPGTCRALPDSPERRATTPHCWRLNSAKALDLTPLPSWTEADGERFDGKASDIGDAILARKDAPASYHLSCVIDDAQSGVSMVVRGADLRPSTPIQRLLQELLGLPEPTYLHHPLITHEDGRRLAKRDLAPTLAAMRESGTDGPALVADLLAGKLPLGFAFRDE